MTQIPSQTTSRLIDATEFMNVKYGVAFNGMITLNFDQLGVASPVIAKQTLTRMNEFLSRKIADFADRFGEPFEHHFLYAHERCSKHGWHVHQAIVVPRALHRQIGPWLKAWKARAFGRQVPDAAIHLRVRFEQCIEEEARRQARIVRYVLKTTSIASVRDRHGRAADFHDLIGLKAVRESDYLGVPRLAGCSQNINRKAQTNHSFQSTLIWEDLLTSMRLYEYHRNRDALRAMDSIRRLNI